MDGIDTTATQGNFKALVNFRVDAGDEVLEALGGSIKTQAVHLEDISK